LSLWQQHILTLTALELNPGLNRMLKLQFSFQEHNTKFSNGEKLLTLWQLISLVDGFIMLVS